MKKATIILLLLLISVSGFSQYKKERTFLVGGNIGYQYPLSDFGKQCKGGFNFRAAGQMFLNPKIGVGAEINFSFLGQGDFWSGNAKGNYDTNYNIGSILLSTFFYFDAWDQDFHPYGGVVFGFYHFRYNSDFTSTSAGTQSQSHKFNLNKVGIAPQIGFLYDISHELSFDANLRCTYIPSIPKSVTQKNLKGQDYAYILGFSSILMPELSVGLYYRF